uniref:Tyrosine N-monooxygenase n=1 Tax=Aegilops tauschii TaxID=37682 RepID=M8BVE0_AEGTA
MVPLPLPPGPWPWPLVGSLPEMVLNKPAFRWIHRVMKDMGTDIACFRLGGVHVVPITCPKIAREVLKKQDKNFLSRPLTFASDAISCGQWNNSERQDGVQDFLDVLITLADGDGKPLLSIDEVKAQSKGIILAAIDNPSNAVEWALAEMVNNPELLAKAVEEMDRVVGRERLVQESDIMQLNYLKACIREAFRLHPIAPFNLPHVAIADTIVAGYHVPKGSNVILSRLALGRNPTVWDEPLHFKPERHMGDNINVVLTESELRFISFSTGRRGCIAASLGTTMSVMLFGRLLHGFTWTKPAGVSAINLSESKHNLFIEKPLELHAEPRLPVHLYPLMHC